MRIGVYGEGVIDRFINHSGYRDVIGGSALNCAVAMRSAGLDALWCARVSSDPDGDLLAAFAGSRGVASERMLRRPEPTSVVTVQTDAAGHPTYGFALDDSVDWQWTVSELEGVFAGLDVIQLSSLSCVLSPGADSLREVLPRLKESGTFLSFDPNARPKAASSDAHAEQMRQRILELVPVMNVVKVSDEDLEWIAPESPVEKMAAAWSTLGPNLVVLTRGEMGADAYIDGKHMAHVDIHRLPVIDSVGAGDTFMAWLIRGIVEDFKCIVPTDSGALTTLLAQAAKAASINCSREGCQPPQRSEVL